MIGLGVGSGVWGTPPRRSTGVVLGVGGGVTNLTRVGLWAGTLRERNEGWGSESGRDGVLDGTSVVERPWERSGVLRAGVRET